MNTTAAGFAPSDSDWLRYESQLERFESELRGGAEPNITDHLPAADDAGRRHVLVELIKLEFEYRWRRGERPHVTDYVRRFPELGDLNHVPRELVAAEDRVRRSTERSAYLAETRAGSPNAASDSGESGAASSSVGHFASGVAPKKLGRYELRERVGHGGFAVVYRAWDPELNREVAIKTPRDEFAGADELIERVRREARAAAQLRHPAIVPIFEVGDDAGRTFIVYQFVHGPTLARLLQETKPAPGQAAAWVMRIAEALEYAHATGIVHRDIKPANILMDRGEQPMIADFGLARGDDAGATLTHEGDILGTPAYMSPEQAQGRGHSADGRSDVYGLGVLLYELITGRAPFVGSTASILQQVINEEPPRPGSIKRQSDVDLETITLKAMAKEPDRRYASAGLMADDLRAYLEHRPIRARRIGPLARAIRWCRRRPAVAATIAAAALVCLVTAAVSVHRVIAERDAARLVSANLALDRATQLATDGESAQALLWLVRSLELSPPGVENLRGAIRANLAAYERLVARPERLLEHRGPVQAVAWSADGRVILTGSDDKTARLWDPATGRPLSEPLSHEHEVKSVTLSLDRTIAVTGDDSGNVRTWDLTKSRETNSFRPDACIYAVAINPDGQTIIAGANGKAYLWNRATGKPIGEPLTHKINVTGFASPVAVAFSVDGRVAVTASRDGVIRRWDAATGDPLGATTAIEHGVTSVSLFRGGESALISRDDNSVVLLDLTRDPIAELPLPFSGILQGGAISRDGHLLATGGSDRTARLWDPQSLSPRGAPMHHPDRVYSVAFSPDAQMVVTACHDGFARIWRISSIESDAAALTLQHGAPVWAMALSEDGSRLFTGSGWRLESGSAQLWNAQTGEPIGSPLPIGVQQLGVAISPDGRTLATGHWDGHTQLWDAAKGEPIGEPIAPIRDRIWNVTLTAFSPDGKTLMTGSFTDNSPLFWDVATRQPIDRKLDHGHVVRTAVWSRDGKLILTGGGDGAAKLWDVATGRQLIPAMQHQGQVGTVALSNDNRFILVGTDADRAQLWDAKTGSPIGPPLEHHGTVRGVAFSPDGQLMATASWDRTARLWDRATGKPVGPPLQHEREVEAVTFSPDGQWVVTGSWDKTARFWKVPTPRDGSVEHLGVWAEVLTNMELDRQGAIRLLPANSWRERRERLNAMTLKSEQLGAFPAGRRRAQSRAVKP